MNHQIDHYREYLTVLEKVLIDKDEDTKISILNKVIQAGIDPDDPILPLMTSVSNVQVLAEEIPNAIEVSLKTFTSQVESLLKDLDSRLNSMALNALKTNESKITDIVKDIFRKKEVLEWKSVRVILPALSIFCGIYGFGMISGGMGVKLLNSQSDSTSHPKLTPTEQKELKWVKSQEGKYAKSLYQWNEEIIKDNCEQQLKSTGIKLSIDGQPIRSGVCILWIKSPNKK